MIGIIAVNNKGYIGKDNKLMWHSSEDLKHFKAMSKDKVMLVGHNTYQELPGVVKKRMIIVDGRGEPFENTLRLNDDIIPVLDGQPRNAKHVICIGGKKTYEKYCHLFTELHISHINDDQVGDVKTPDWENLNPECIVYHYNFEVNKPREDYDVTISPSDGHQCIKDSRTNKKE